jgi:futalosine hydrolase
MKILITSATVFEMAPLMMYFEEKCKKESFFKFSNEKHTFYPFVTGVGAVNTAMGLVRFTDVRDMDVILNMGIAGSYNPSLNLGEVVEVTKDRFGDLGVENADGSFTDVHELELIDKDYYPFKDGWINIDKIKIENSLKKVSGVTVNKVTGTNASAKNMMDKYHADIETMEGAAFMLACRTLDIKFHQIRSISNYVENRDRNKWKLDLAIDNLNNEIIKLLS